MWKLFISGRFVTTAISLEVARDTVARWRKQGNDAYFEYDGNCVGCGE